MNHDSLNAQFLSTSWSLVEALRRGDQMLAVPALDELCRTYWPPLYVFLRRKGYQPSDAEDLVQGFFQGLLQRGSLEQAEPERGKLRTFLLAGLENHISDIHRRKHAAKRGGPGLPLNVSDGEKLLAALPDQTLPPDQAYDREWALSLLDAAIAEAGTEHEASASPVPFALLRPFLSSRVGVPQTYEAIASETGVPAGTLKSLVHRLRQSLPERLLAQVRATLDNPTAEEVRAELHTLAGYL